MSSKKTRTRKTSGDGPNKVRKEHFRLAVDLAKSCKPEKDGKPHPKVGAVILKEGKIIAQAHRGELGRGDHAEFIALEKRARDKAEVEGADLITTLEPCTTRAHDKRPCVSWIKSRRIRKVWIGTLDYNPAIAGLGEIELQNDGILIGRFPDEFATEVIEDNREFFEYVHAKQPKISPTNQRSERKAIIDTLNERLQNENQTRDLFLNRMMTPISKKALGDLEALINIFDKRVNKILNAVNYAHAANIDSAGSWVQLGSSLYSGQMFGMAALAYRVATDIDATGKWAWNGLVRSNLELNREDSTWPFQYITELIDTSPESIHSKTWLRNIKYEDDIGIKVRMLAKALKLGNQSDELWSHFEILVNEALSKDEPKGIKMEEITQKSRHPKKEKTRLKRQREVTAWAYLGWSLESTTREEEQKKCYSVVDKMIFAPEVVEILKQMWERVSTSYP